MTKFLNSSLVILIRNTLNKSVVHTIIEKDKSISISDAFIWRTDKNFETKFIFTDIFGVYLKNYDTFVEIQIFNKENNLIKKININNLKKTNELIISKNLLNGLQDYGSFYIFHYLKGEKIMENIAVSNRCYTGYKKQNGHYTYVHGNLLAKSKSIYKNQDYERDIIQRSLFKNQFYKIQKNFSNFDSTELFFSNPFNKKIKFYVNNKKYSLKTGNTIKVNIQKIDTVEIRSDIMFFRPTVFSYRKNFIDVHHS